MGPKLRLLSILIALHAPLAAGKGDAPAPGDLRSAGSVNFAISCASAVKPDFTRAVALLHSFFYEESRRIFTSVAERDPGCAMAQWGIGMTWWHPIWAPPNPEEFAAGEQAAKRAATMKSTRRERMYIDAINAYYAPPPAKDGASSAKGRTRKLHGKTIAAPKKDREAVGQSCHGPVGPRDRVAAYEAAMKKVYDRNPKDFEAQVFYAFAVLAVGYATPADTKLASQKKAGAMLEKLWKKNPHHPGVAHYLIHAYDYPALAQKALPAAQAYANIAPWVPHALHMPSHIFTRLGMWDDAVTSNEASAAASRAYAKQRKRKAAEVEELHALDYMVYSYLQESRDAEAKKVVDEAAKVRETFPQMEFIGAYALAAMPARYALEREAWDEAASLKIPERPQWAQFPFTEALFEYAHALGAAHSNERAAARKAIDRMTVLRDATTDPKFEYFRKHLDLQIKAASAWLAFDEGRDDDAVAGLREAADGEDALGKHPVTPGALVPAREQLGSMLLEMEQPKEALQAFEAALKNYPARFRGLYGAGLAAEQLGDRKLARDYFEKLMKQAAGADAARAELIHARGFVAAAATPPIAVNAYNEPRPPSVAGAER